MFNGLYLNVGDVKGYLDIKGNLDSLDKELVEDFGIVEHMDVNDLKTLLFLFVKEDFKVKFKEKFPKNQHSRVIHPNVSYRGVWYEGKQSLEEGLMSYGLDTREWLWNVLKTFMVLLGRRSVKHDKHSGMTGKSLNNGRLIQIKQLYFYIAVSVLNNYFGEAENFDDLKKDLFLCYISGYTEGTMVIVDEKLQIITRRLYEDVFSEQCTYI